MAPEKKTPFAERTAGSLEGLELARLDELPGEQLAVSLAAVGDAIRLELNVPGGLRTQLRALPLDRVLGAIRAVAVLPGAWSLPAHVPSTMDEDPGLAWALRQRDEIESVLVAARASLSPRGVWVDQSEEAIGLRQQLARVDLSCGGQVTRSLADALLGERLQVAGEAAWLEAVAWAEEIDEAPAAPEIERAVAASTMPGARAVHAYLTRGDLAAWVEAAAARSKVFAEELASTIGTYREQRARVGITARRWQLHHASAPAPSNSAVAIPFEGPRVLAYAAADTAELPRDESIEHDLGRLAPLDAQAKLVVTAGDVTLHIFEGATSLTSVSMGGKAATRFVDEARWTVSAPRPKEAVELKVVDAQGRTFDAPIAFIDSQ